MIGCIVLDIIGFIVNNNVYDLYLFFILRKGVLSRLLVFFDDLFLIISYDFIFVGDGLDIIFSVYLI